MFDYRLQVRVNACSDIRMVINDPTDVMNTHHFFHCDI